MAHILVFDSGVGGLSVLDEIKAVSPACSITYVADNAFYPYGSKSESSLVERVGRVIGAAVSKVQPELVVVACNSASTLALPSLREQIEVPIVGTVPAIKPACEASRSRVIGLLGTPGTVKRAYTDDLIQKHGAGCDVIRFGSESLVDLAERKLAGMAITHAQVAAGIRGLFKQARSNLIDTVVLACTHYPLLREELESVSREGIDWIDSGKAIARRVTALLDEMDGSLARAGQDHHVFLTKLDDNAMKLKPAFSKRGFDQVFRLDLA